MTLLHHIGELLRDNLAAIPLSWVRVLFVALPLATLVWVLWLPREDQGPDLRWWAAAALLIQVALYTLI